MDISTIDKWNFLDRSGSRGYEAVLVPLKLTYHDITVICSEKDERVFLRQGYSEAAPYLWELINNDDSPKFVFFRVMGGSGLQIREVPPKGTWREGVGEEYINYYSSYEEAYLKQVDVS